MNAGMIIGSTAVELDGQRVAVVAHGTNGGRIDEGQTHAGRITRQLITKRRLALGNWMLAADFGMLGANHWMLGADNFMLGAGFDMLDAKMNGEKSDQELFSLFFDHLAAAAICALFLRLSR